MSRITHYASYHPEGSKGRITLYAPLLALLLTLGWTASSVPAQAQESTGTATPKAAEDPSAGSEETLDTILARAAAKSFLITLTRPELSGTMNFYLTEDVKGSNILAGLETLPVSSFEITASGWANHKTYQVQATLQPEDRQVTIYTGKYGGRWQVERIGLPLPPALVGVTASSAAAQGDAGPRLSILAQALNVREGPGVSYRVVDVLLQGEQVEVVRRDSASGWCQVRLDDGRIGWVSGDAAYVRVGSDTGSLPAAPAPFAGTPAAPGGTGKLIFQTVSGGPIYVINPDGAGLRYITNGIDPQLSPDGQQIAFTRWEPEYALFTIKLDGSGERSWARGWRQMKSPTWTADGSSLVFSWQSGGRLDEEWKRINLAEAARNGDDLEVPGNARDVEIENGILKYRIPADAHWSLKQVNLADGQLRDLGAGQYAYSPTGNPAKPNEVIYTFGGSGIASLDATSNNVRPITGDPRDRAPVISPDGSKVAVSYWQDGNWEVYTMNLDGSNRQRLTSTPITVIADQTKLNTEFVDGKERIVPDANVKWNNAAPVWSPDGQQIAFLTDRTGKWEIWIMNADGSNQRPMFPNGALDGLTLNYAGVDERMLSWQP